jgi:hypothetical protein
LLQNGIFLDPVLAEFEFYVGVAAEGSSSGARSVHDHPVYFACGYSAKGLFVTVELDIGYACTIEPLFCLAQGNLSRLVDENLTLAVKEMSDG